MQGMPRRLVLGTAVALPLVALAERVGSAAENARRHRRPGDLDSHLRVNVAAGPPPTGVPGNVAHRARRRLRGHVAQLVALEHPVPVG